MTIRNSVLPIALVLLAATASPAQGPVDPVARQSLNALMPAYGVATHRIQNALWREDYATVAEHARRIAANSGFSPEQQARIVGSPRQATAWFGEADAKVHDSALALAAAADSKNALKVVKALGSMQEGCAACHTNYRARMRAK